MIPRALPALLLVATLAGTSRAAPGPAADTTFTSVHRELRTSKGARIEADQGRLLVPEDRADPASRRIPIHYLRLRSRAASPRAPLFYLTGGPGSRAVSDSPGTLDF